MAAAQSCAAADNTPTTAQDLQFITPAPPTAQIAQDRQYAIWCLAAPEEVELTGLEMADFDVDYARDKACGRNRNRKCDLGSYDFYVQTS